MAQQPVIKRKAGFPISIYCPIEKELKIKAVKKHLKSQNTTLTEYLMLKIEAYYQEFIVPLLAKSTESPQQEVQIREESQQ